MPTITPITPPPFNVDDQLSAEDALSHAAALLTCATATAYECGDSLKGTSRDLAFAVLHLVEMAKVMVERSLEKVTAR